MTVQTNAMWSGDGARYVSLRAAPFERFLRFPERVDPEEWTRITELLGGETDGADPEALGGADGPGVVCQYALASCGEERWRGPFCYGDLSALFANLALPEDVDDASRAAWAHLTTTLGTGAATDPWWVRARFHGSCQYGLLDPGSVRALAEALERTRVCERVIELARSGGLGDAKGLTSLGAFLRRAADAGCWVFATEWS